jgi:hypothetical protein
MTYLQTQAAKLVKSSEIATKFADKYGDRLPEGLADLGVGSMYPTLYISTGYSEQNRIKALTLIGEVFGRDGWTQHLNFDRTSYNWKRTLDGVFITIGPAEKIPTEIDARPVPPSKFPIQLTDAE